MRITTAASYGRSPRIIAPIGPKYHPMSDIADWRCLTSWSGLACAAAWNEAPAPTTAATAIITIFFFIRFS